MSEPELRWWVASLADGGTHRGTFNPATRSVHALCGREFRALPVGWPPRPGPLPLGMILDPEQACAICRRLAR